MYCGAGAFKTTDNGEFVEIASVVGGTGSLTGASGVLQIGGTFTFINGGQADYTGMVCVP